MYAKRTWFSILIASLLLALVLPAVAPAGAFAAQAQEDFPEIIPLPDGFQPEGIVIGRGTTFYVGSIPTGAIYRGDLKTGQGEILVPGAEGRQAIGLAYDGRSNTLFVAGGPTGKAFAYDAASGELRQEYTLTTASPTFVNDAEVTSHGVYFTDSNQPYVYHIPLGRRGRLPEPDAVQAIPLSGDYVQTEGFNANGIEALLDGARLVIVNSTLGTLYLVDPKTGAATLVPLEGGDVTQGDGLLVVGKTLYVVQNQLNRIAVVEPNEDLSGAVITGYLTDPDFRVPTTIDRYKEHLYAVNARFDTEPTPETEYEVVKVPLEPQAE